MLANGGRLVSPHITRGLRSGDALAATAAPSGVPMLDPSVTRIVLGWMESVVEKGSGKGASLPGYRIGGKTGTAQKAQNGVYIPGARICSFVAVLPIEDPRYAVLVVVDEPQGANATAPPWRCRCRARSWRPCWCSRRFPPAIRRPRPAEAAGLPPEPPGAAPGSCGHSLNHPGGPGSPG